MKDTSKKSKATSTNTINVLPSLRRCIKIDNTRYAFTEAITIATVTVKLLKSIPATVTVTVVKAKRASQTKM